MGRGGPREAGREVGRGRGRELEKEGRRGSKPGAEWAGWETSFPFLILFPLSFLRFLFFLPFQIEFLIKCMLHKITHQIK
jgi:hypothetical protein